MLAHLPPQRKLKFKKIKMFYFIFIPPATAMSLNIFVIHVVNKVLFLCSLNKV